MKRYLTLKTSASIPKDEAVSALKERYPGCTILSFTKVGDQWKANIKQALEELPEPEDALPPGDDEGLAESDSHEEKEEKAEDSEADKLDEILHLLKKLVGDDDPLDEGGLDDDNMGDSKTVLPPPVKEPAGAGKAMGGPMSVPSFAKRRFLPVVREDGAEVTLKQAVAELNNEYGEYGFTVAKISRRDSTIVAGLVRRITKAG